MPKNLFLTILVLFISFFLGCAPVVEQQDTSDGINIPPRKPLARECVTNIGITCPLALPRPVGESCVCNTTFTNVLGITR